MNRISLYWRCQLIGWGLYSSVPIIYLFSFAASVHLSDELVPVRFVNVFDSFGFYLHTCIKIFITGIVISHVMRVAIKKLKVLEKSFRQQVLYFLVLTVIFSLFFLIILNGMTSGFDFLDAVNYYRQTYLIQAIIFTGTFMIWNLVYFVYSYMKRIRKEEKENADIRIQMLELEAHALRAQMNPHFIFNCLNSIKSLIQQHDEVRSVTYLTTFSKLIRTLFNNADKKEISLFDEMETCKLYLQLEAMRFDTKFSYAVNMDETIDLKSIHVQALIIQPFIENAIWHGIMPRSSGGHVSLDVNKKNSVIEIIVDDDGIGREASQQNRSVSGLTHQSKGVNLTQSRLELNNLLQQRQASLKIIDKKDENGIGTGTKVIISIKEEI